jgi:hypothetical protein
MKQIRFILFYILYKGKGKATPVTGRESPEDCETSRLPHFLDNRLKDAREVVSLACRRSLTPRKIPGRYLFLLEAESNPVP